MYIYCYWNLIFIASIRKVIFKLLFSLDYLPGSKERKELEAELKRLSDNVEDVPIIIGNEKFKTKDVRYQVMVRNVIII